MSNTTSLSTARLMREIRRREAVLAPVPPQSSRDPLAEIIRRIESAPGSDQSLAAMKLLSDLVENRMQNESLAPILDAIGDELTALIVNFTARFETEYRPDPRLARFRRPRR